MEPFRALTLLAVTGVISLVGAGAGGFYAGYTAGQKTLELTSGPVVTLNGTPGVSVSLKPILDNINSLSKQIETLASNTKPSEDAGAASKPVLDEIKSLSRQLEGMKSQVPGAPAAVQTETVDYSDDLNGIKDQIKALSAKFDKQEPKAPKALIDEIRALSASVQAQEPSTRRAVSEEFRAGFATLQSSEPRAPKVLLDEVRNIAASVKAQEARPQPSSVDQFKVLSAQIQNLSERSGTPNSSASDQTDSGASAGIAQLKQLLISASDQFGKCQTQLASLSAAGFQQSAQQSGGLTTAALPVPQNSHQELAPVFYDNVMLRKDQEKQYDEIGVKLSLQSVTPRQVRLGVNRQGFALAFGERKVFRSQDVECELNLMETNLNDSQARISISCKR